MGLVGRREIQENQINFVLPTELGNLKSLTTLYVNDNNFFGSIPAELSGIREL